MDVKIQISTSTSTGGLHSKMQGILKPKALDPL